MSTTVANQTPYAGSTLPVAPGQPGTVAADTDVAPTTRAGITAGTTPTAYDDGQVTAPAGNASYVVPATSTAFAPTATDWKRVGATDADIAMIPTLGLGANELRSIYESMYANQASSGQRLQGDDPLAGTPLANTGLLYDAESGLAIDPQTNDIYDPETGAQLDPTTGQPMTTGTDAAGATPAAGANDTAPGWNDEYATKYTEVMTASGMSPEGAEIMVQQLATDTTLNAAELDAGLEFYATPEGAAQLKEIDAQFHAGVPLSAYLPLIGMGIAAATVIGGVGITAYKIGDRTIQNRATSIMDRAGNGDAKAASRIAKPGMFDLAASRAATMSGNGAKAAQMSDRARASLQMLYERDGTFDVTPKPGTSISTTIDDMIKNGFDAKGNPTGPLAKLAEQKGVTRLAGESVESFAVRVAEKHGVHLKGPAAANFISGAETKAHFNNGGGTAYRPYDTKVPTGPGWAAKRAAADRMGSILHPIERARLVTEARKVGPGATAMNAHVTGGGSKLGGMGKSMAAEIAARSTGAPTIPAGLKGIGAQSLKSVGSKMGIAGVAIGIGLESGLIPGFQGPNTIAGSIKEHGVDSKEAGNAIGGASGRVAGGIAGFAAGAAIGSVIPVGGTIVGGVIGLTVGLAASYGASKALGAVGEHAGDALSAADKFADKIVGKGPMDALQGASKTAAKAVTNPVGAAIDAAEGVKDLGSKAVDKFKGLFD